MKERLKERFRRADPIVPMVFVTLMTLVTGLVLALPFDTLSASPSFRFLYLHGGDEVWSAILIVLGVLLLGHCLRELTTVSSLRTWERRLEYILWQCVSPFWIFIGASFVFNNPGSIGAVVYVLSGGMAWWIARQISRKS